MKQTDDHVVLADTPRLELESLPPEIRGSTELVLALLRPDWEARRGDAPPGSALP